MQFLHFISSLRQIRFWFWAFSPHVTLQLMQTFSVMGLWAPRGESLCKQPKRLSVGILILS